MFEIFFFCIFSLWNIHLSYSLNPDESSTGALIKFPYVSPNSPLYGKEWPVSLGQFGVYDYGGSLEGYLVLPMNTTYHLECTQEAIGANPYIHWLKDWTGDNPYIKYFFLVDRGDCPFVNKIENVQVLGSSAVILFDYVEEPLFTLGAPENFDTSNLNIPAVLLQLNYSSILMSALNVLNWDPRNIAETEYPDPSDMNWTIARLEWGLPHPDARVEYQLYTSSIDPETVEFKKNWRNTALNLEYNNYTTFTPHVYILNGSTWRCTAGDFRCGKQCTNSGRYCAVDPEGDLKKGLNGMDVIQENLRSTCVWKYIQAKSANESIWWDYMNLWNKNCWQTSDPVNTFTKTCSFQQMSQLKSDLSSWVDKCVNTSGGYDYRGGVNTILDEETRIRYQLGIYGLPSIVVNTMLIHGDMDCAKITIEDCPVLDAICAGFIEGTDPLQCHYTPAPTLDYNCTTLQKDCRGVCYGGWIVDKCGNCFSGANDPSFDNCVGCDGKPYSNKKINPCGYCLLNSSSDFATYGMDCKGICNGGYVIDACNQCLKSTDAEWDNCVGCDGIAYSGKKANVCGLCLNASASNFDTAGKDCRGVCQGSYSVDRCGQCLSGSTDPSWDSCVGCDDMPNSGKQINPCGYCLNRSNTNWETYGTDCRGVCYGGYVTDSCGKCLSPEDKEFNSCEYTSNSNSSSSASSSSSNRNTINTTVIIIVVICVLLIILIAGLIIWRLYKRQQVMDKKWNDIVKTYQLMEDRSTKSKPKRKEMVQVPDDDPEDNI